MVAPTSFFADYGCHVRILEEARVLTRLGQKVTVATYYNGRDVPDLDIRRTMPIPWRRDYEVGSSRHKMAFDGLLVAATLITALRTRPDVIHGHLHEGALVGALVARLLGKPLVFDFQGSLSSEMVDHGFLSRDGRFYGPVRRIERWINGLPTAVVASTYHGAQLLAGDFGLDASRIHALPDCVDATTFRPGLLDAAVRRNDLGSLGVAPGRRVVVYLGLLAAHQGTNVLLRAARIVVERRPRTHFLIMGFPGEQRYGQLARELGIDDHVTFPGRIPYEQAARRLALGDVAVAPKLSETEGSGKILNYMAMGLPTVTFDTPVSREYLGEAGIYAPRGDAAGLAAGLLALLGDAERRRSLALELRERAVKEYDWGHAGEMLLDVYDEVLARKRKEAPV